jgi:hypothetical protein
VFLMELFIGVIFICKFLAAVSHASISLICFASIGSQKRQMLQTDYFLPLLLCWVGVHCGIYIYKSSYNVSNISYLNSPPPPLSFIILPQFLEQFQQVSLFCIYTHVYTVFAPYSSSYSPCHLSPPTSVKTTPLEKPVLPPIL